MDVDRVVVGADGSAASAEAVRWGAQEAARRGLELSVVHVLAPTPHAGMGLFAGPPLTPDTDLGDAATAMLDRMAGLARDEEPELRVSTAVVPGPVSPTLLEVSRGAAVLVLGARGRSAIARLLLGSTTRHVVSHAACPVVVTRGGTPGSLRGDRVVVGVDGSPASRQAVEFAFTQAAWRRLPLHAVHGLGEPASEVWGVESYRDEVETQALLALSEALAGWRERFPDVEVTQVVRLGHPVETLLAAATGADLVVVGSRGHGAFAGMLLGSVSTAVAHHAPCPVAVVRPRPDPTDRAATS